jgi:solute carrier family 25 carnitine/acylcarnitine transporter 20/29
MASLFAGCIGGAVGVGVSYPFDTLSTKAQVRLQGKDQLNLVRSINVIWKNEGIRGFFEGVIGTVRYFPMMNMFMTHTTTYIFIIIIIYLSLTFMQMIGQAFIKAIQFAVNEVTFLWLEQHSTIQSNILKMAIAGILAGLLSSFVVSPVELVKIRMQTQNKLCISNKKDDDIMLDSTSQHMMIYKNELDCAQSMIRNEGWRVLFLHGLGTTIIREIPSFALYFVAYGLLAQSAWKDVFGRNMSPLVFGAVAGWAMWIPTYPIDIVKTLVQVQTTEKENALDLRSPIRVTKNMYRVGGIRAFFDGLEPKLARAAVKHAVTFWVYEILMTYFRTRSIS